MEYLIYLIAFLAVFLTNAIPLITPPTWTVLSFIAFNYYDKLDSLSLLITIGILAAFSGRYILILTSKKFIRQNFLNKKSIKNINNLKKHLIKNKSIVYWTFFLEAITPLPSDHLFIAYGLTNLKARYALVPFFIGRIFTYSFWVYLASYTSQHVFLDSAELTSYFNGSFILLQLFLILLIYLFIRIDWENLITNHRIRLYN
jgi:membrane protein DedA with SNARE-associated domain